LLGEFYAIARNRFAERSSGKRTVKQIRAVALDRINAAGKRIKYRIFC
jgi:hypothetical protein